MLDAVCALIIDMLFDLDGLLCFKHAERVQFVQFVHFGVCHVFAVPLTATRSRPKADRIQLFTVPSGS